MTRVRTIFVCVILIAIQAAAVSAQQTDAPWSLVCADKSQENEHFTCRGHVIFVQGNTKLYTDELEWFRDEDRAIAQGNVTFTQGRNQINADKADLNTKTRLGTFYNAQGFADNRSSTRPVAPAPGGFAAPPVIGQDTDVYFFGEVIEKIGPKKYTITNGGFTTCVQPTPRWDLHAGKITVNVDRYTLARNALFRVKAVPVLYLPFVYYPTNEDNRSTGFLLPNYGFSSLNGQQFGDQFFWAINRSQDATLMYDHYSKLGEGYGAEYRYNLGSGVGNFTTHFLDAKVGQRNLRFIGSASQTLPHRLRASANADFFTSLSTNQRFQTNIVDSSSSQRTYGGNVNGGWGHYSLSGTFTRTESFSNPTDFAVQGNSPLVSFSQSDRRLFSKAPVYFTFGSEYAHLDHQTKQGDVVTSDRTLHRTDFTPKVRYPLRLSQFLSVDSSVAWRDTFYSRSQDPLGTTVLEDNLNRTYYTLESRVTGPVFNRIWDTPGSKYAERFKHTVEPFVTISRTSRIDNFRRVLSGVDQSILGGTTSYNYGLRNRLLAKRKVGPTSQAQQIASLAISQTYYSNTLAAQFDPTYGTSSLTTVSTSLSPIKVDASVTPTPRVTGTLQAEIDSKYYELRQLTAGTTYNWSQGSTALNWSQKFLIKDLVGFNDPVTLNRLLTFSSDAHTRDNRYGGKYNLWYDAVHASIIQQQIQAYYSPQCCGFSLQYSRGILNGAVNTKYMFSFTLAGLGTFSPFDQGMGGGLARQR